MNVHNIIFCQPCPVFDSVWNSPLKKLGTELREEIGTSLISYSTLKHIERPPKVPVEIWISIVPSFIPKILFSRLILKIWLSTIFITPFSYYFFQLVRALWLVNLAGRTLLYRPLNWNVCFSRHTKCSFDPRDIINILLTSSSRSVL